MKHSLSGRILSAVEVARDLATLRHDCEGAFSQRTLQALATAEAELNRELELYFGFQTERAVGPSTERVERPTLA